MRTDPVFIYVNSHLLKIYIYKKIDIDQFVKSRNSIELVIPAKARIQLFQNVLDPGFPRGDAPRGFLRDHRYYG